MSPFPGAHVNNRDVHSTGSPVPADSMVSHMTRSPVFLAEPHLPWWKTVGMSYVTASTRSLLDMVDFNWPYHPPEGRECVPYTTTQLGFPSDEAETPLPMRYKTPQLWHPPNWERSYLLQTSLCPPPLLSEAVINLLAGKAPQDGNFVL